MEGERVIKRHSRQRSKIIEVLEGTKVHPTAAEVYAAVSEDFPNISLGTVYRDLRQLEKAGLIRRLTAGSGAERFDYDTSFHHHFICDCCGRVYDVETSGSVEVQGGFEVKRAELQFYGICPECRAKNGK